MVSPTFPFGPGRRKERCLASKRDVWIDFSGESPCISIFNYQLSKMINVVKAEEADMDSLNLEQLRERAG